MSVPVFAAYAIAFLGKRKITYFRATQLTNGCSAGCLFKWLQGGNDARVGEVLLRFDGGNSAEKSQQPSLTDASCFRGASLVSVNQ